MDGHRPPSTSLFDVYLRLRPPHSLTSDRFLDIDDSEEVNETPESDTLVHKTHITIKPPAHDHRKRAVERFGFTRVFDESASQRHVFDGTDLLPVIQGVLGPDGRAGRDGLVATLGVTGSGKSHTILGSKSTRGLVQMSLDVLFSSIQERIISPNLALHELAASDVSEAQLLTADAFLNLLHGGPESQPTPSRDPTPMQVRPPSVKYPSLPKYTPPKRWRLPQMLSFASPTSAARRDFQEGRTPSHAQTTTVGSEARTAETIRPVSGMARIARSVARLRNSPIKEPYITPGKPEQLLSTPSKSRRYPTPAIIHASEPNVTDVDISSDPDAAYAITVSMYEVYNDRIFDLLTGTYSNTTNAKTQSAKDARRRPLLFKSTEYSPDRKVVAGLKKVVCAGLEDALGVLDAGLMERRVAGTGSNATSSRSHGFFCVEVKRKGPSTGGMWNGNTLTIVDLAGSERARAAKTAGSTLAEAGKINESLMYLGQCMQMQSDNSANHDLLSQQNTHNHDGNTSTTSSNLSITTKPSHVPYRQCKLTELLFSNVLQPTTNSYQTRTATKTPQQQQKALMIVTADASGDFNATYQILRYSALAREVTVPRIPSITSQILSSSTTSQPQQPHQQQHHNKASSAKPPGAWSAYDDEGFVVPPTPTGKAHGQTSNVVAGLQAEITLLRHELHNETTRRIEAENSWAAAEEKAEESEALIRMECADAFEERLQQERERWMGMLDEVKAGNEGWLDGKVDLLMNPGSGVKGAQEKGFEIFEDGPDEEQNGGQPSAKKVRSSNGVVEGQMDALKEENEHLRLQLEDFTLKQRDNLARTPSRKLKGLKGRKWIVDDEDGEEENGENVAPV